MQPQIWPTTNKVQLLQTIVLCNIYKETQHGSNDRQLFDTI